MSSSSSTSSESNNEPRYNYDDEELLLVQLNMLHIQRSTVMMALHDSEMKRIRLAEELEDLEKQIVHVRQSKKRKRKEKHTELWNNYFSENPVFSNLDFRRRFRMRRPLFNRILTDICAHDNYFVQKFDACGRPGLTPHLKIVAAFRYICYASAMDSYDETFTIGKSTGYESLRRFCQAIIDVYSDRYLRDPTAADIQRITAENAERGFPGMLGSIDCMHWRWTSCPMEEHGAFLGHHHAPTVILEAVATRDTWVWKSFFGTPGSNNDINVLSRSPVFEDILTGRVPEHHFVVNGHEYRLGYYLADGIYPSYSTFVKSEKNPRNEKERIFARFQEGARKEIERTFGILQKRFAVLGNPAKLWDLEDLTKIVEACIIMHNMIVEDERHTNLPTEYEEPTMTDDVGGLQRDPDVLYNEYIARSAHIHDKSVHRQLHEDLKEHIFAHFGRLNVR